jgi:8-oxo-dGTP pyrophosphatase MutT (NUDIX family)
VAKRQRPLAYRRSRSLVANLVAMLDQEAGTWRSSPPARFGLLPAGTPMFKQQNKQKESTCLFMSSRAPEATSCFRYLMGRLSPPLHRRRGSLRGAVDAVMTAEPKFVARPGQVDYTHVRYAPVLNALVVCQGKVLLLQRSSGMRSYPNCWCGISGYLDDNRSVEDKVRQEMQEEVGITDDRVLAMERGTVLLQEAPECDKSWLVVPVLVRVKGAEYRLDWESQAAGWFSLSEALVLDLLPGFEAVIAQYRDVIK